MKNSNKADAKRSEHLSFGEKPILACIEYFPFLSKTAGYADMEDVIFTSDAGSPESPTLHALVETNCAYNVNYYASTMELRCHGSKTGENRGEYVISAINTKDKFSAAYLYCTGTSVVGKHLEMGENISLFSHQDPNKFLFTRNKKCHALFFADMKSSLLAMRNLCVPGSIDAVIFGGQYSNCSKNDWFARTYSASLSVLCKIISDCLGFSPIIICGPESTYEEDRQEVYLSTKYRRLFVVRSNVGNSMCQSYTFSDYERYAKEWAKEG